MNGNSYKKNRLGRFGAGLVLLVLLSACDRPGDAPANPPVGAGEVTLSAPPPAPEESPGKRLAKQLRDPEIDRRVDAANQLGAMAEAGTLDDGPLQQLINTFEMDDTPAVQAAVIIALGKSCHPAAMDILVRSLNRETSRISGLTLSLMGQNGGFRMMATLEAFSKRMGTEGTQEALMLQKAADSAIKQIQLRGGRRETCQSPQPEEFRDDAGAQGSNGNPAEAGSGPS